jgi:hypothetical protein
VYHTSRNGFASTLLKSFYLKENNLKMMWHSIKMVY